MRLFSAFAKNELLCSRSSRSSSRCSCVFFLFYFFSFLCFFCFFSRLCFFFLYCRSSSVSRSSSRLGSISSENDGGEGNSYEGGYDCGQNFFHLYYLQRNVFDLLLQTACQKLLFRNHLFFISLQVSVLCRFCNEYPIHNIKYLICGRSVIFMPVLLRIGFRRVRNTDGTSRQNGQCRPRCPCQA